MEKKDNHKFDMDLFEKFIQCINPFLDKMIDIDIINCICLEGDNNIKMLKELIDIFDEPDFLENISKFDKIDINLETTLTLETNFRKDSDKLMDFINILNIYLNPNHEIIIDEKVIDDTIYRYLLIKSNIISPVNCKFYKINEIKELDEYEIRVFSNNYIEKYHNLNNLFILDIKYPLPPNLVEGVLFYGNHSFIDSFTTYFIPGYEMDYITIIKIFNYLDSINFYQK